MSRALAASAILIAILVMWLTPWRNKAENAAAYDPGVPSSSNAPAEVVAVKPATSAAPERIALDTTPSDHESSEPPVPTFVEMQGERLRVEWEGAVKRLYFDNGQLMSQGAEIDGKREGHQEVWYRNGALQACGAWSGGSRSGLWKYYSEGGVLLAVGKYVDGKKLGL